MSMESIQCPYCQHEFDVDQDWIVRNGRVFCGSCCKAFDVKLEEPKKNYYGEYYD